MCQVRMVIQVCHCPQKNEKSDFHYDEIVTNQILPPEMQNSWQWSIAENGWFLRRREDTPKKVHEYRWEYCDLFDQLPDADPNNCPALANFANADFADPNHPHRLPPLPETYGGRYCRACKLHGAGNKVRMTIYHPKKPGGGGGEGPSRFHKSGTRFFIHNGPEIIPGQPNTCKEV